MPSLWLSDSVPRACTAPPHPSALRHPQLTKSAMVDHGLRAKDLQFTVNTSNGVREARASVRQAAMQRLRVRDCLPPDGPQAEENPSSGRGVRGRALVRQKKGAAGGCVVCAGGRTRKSFLRNKATKMPLGAPCSCAGRKLG